MMCFVLSVILRPNKNFKYKQEICYYVCKINKCICILELVWISQYYN
jgi:hypothetical protein